MDINQTRENAVQQLASTLAGYRAELNQLEVGIQMVERVGCHGAPKHLFLQSERGEFIMLVGASESTLTWQHLSSPTAAPVALTHDEVEHIMENGLNNASVGWEGATRDDGPWTALHGRMYEGMRQRHAQVVNLSKSTVLALQALQGRAPSPKLGRRPSVTGE